MKKQNTSFNFDKKTREILDARLIVALFETLYNQKNITKKEFKKLTSEIYRRFHIED